MASGNWEEQFVNPTQGRSAKPDDPGRVYYDHNGVQVVGGLLITPYGEYHVGELYGLATVRGPFHPFVTYTVGASALFLVAVGVSWPLFGGDAAVAWLGVAAVAVVPIAMTLALLRFKPRAYQLWAYYRGERGPVFWTRDETVYGQVCRALVRAREAARPPVG
jgi:hypothetical protein